MSANYREPEDLLSDESFLSWYFKTSEEGPVNWEHWMADDADRTRLVQQAIALLDATRQPEKAIPTLQLEEAELSLFKRIGELPHNLPTNDAASYPKTLPLYRDRRWRIAAAVFIVLIAGIGVTKFRSRRPEIKTEYGQVDRRQLPDGTEVTMNANSRLTWSSDWKDGIDREVWMNGEAYFHVSKTPMKSRFIVHTDHFTIIVTGTQFNVVNRGGTENVLLEEGSVILHTQDGRDLDMKPGDFVAFRGRQLEKRPVQSDSLTAWKDQKLVFDKTPLRELVKIINDRYGVAVKLANESIGDSTITAILPDNNLDVLLQSLEATSVFDVTREGNQITITAHAR